MGWCQTDSDTPWRTGGYWRQFGAPSGMPREKSFGLIGALPVEQRAGDVDQPSAGLVDVEVLRADQDLGGETVDAAKGLGQIRRFRHEGQRLTEGPQDRREAGGGGVGDPA